MNKKLLMILVLVIVIVLVLGFLVRERQGITIITDKKEYESGEILRVNIKNNLGKDICFSSCYPYYLERKNENWEGYNYIDCYEFNGNGYCIGAKKARTFELTLPQIPAGLHRLATPVCIGCSNEDSFREDARFYSNEFFIK